MQTINVRELNEKRVAGNVDLIDVRMPTEFRELHADGARSVPLDSLDPSAVMSARGDSAEEPLYVICQSGNRSTQACKKFTDAGFTNIINVDGGTSAWNSAGLPVIRGKKSISLMRQVQITAGFLALLGAVLAFFVHPNFILLSGFIGAGLMFAGITDTCAMGMMLAKMPWNKCGPCDGGNGSCPV